MGLNKKKPASFGGGLFVKIIFLNSESTSVRGYNNDDHSNNNYCYFLNAIKYFAFQH